MYTSKYQLIFFIYYITNIYLQIYIYTLKYILYKVYKVYKYKVYKVYKYIYIYIYIYV